MAVNWLTQEKLLKCMTWTAGKESLRSPFLYLKRLCDLFKSHNFTCNYTDISPSDEQVSDNKKYTSFPPSIRATKFQWTPALCHRSQVLFSVAPTTTLKRTVVFQGWPLALHAIWVVQKNSTFPNHKSLNLSIVIFPAFCPFVFYNSTESHLPRGYWNSSAEPETYWERRNYQKGWGS